VHYYGEALRSCIMPIAAVAGAEIVTLEGLGTAEKPHPLQQAFIEEQAAQCGYCINGMIMQAAALLATNSHPTEGEVRQALAGNLCKCGTHVRILRAIMRVAQQ
jgi:nicotinate dehydrogenase subunit A